MNRSTLLSLSAAFVTIVAWSPQAAAAEPGPAMTASEVRALFVSQGYRAEGQVTWWTNHVTSFSVFDPTEQASPTARIIMVLVYPDIATALVERSRAEASEAAETARAFTDTHGPHLVPGYGFSTWRDNVAVVQTTQGDLQRRFSEELDWINMVGAQPEVAARGTAQAPQAVDLDILRVLNRATVDL